MSLLWLQNAIVSTIVSQEINVLINWIQVY